MCEYGPTDLQISQIRLLLREKARRAMHIVYHHLYKSRGEEMYMHTQI